MNQQRLPPEVEAATPGVPDELVVATPEEELFHDPADFSAVGGPESEPAYGRSRAVAGEFPFNEHGGPYDRDEPSRVERGGIDTGRRVVKRT